MLVTGMREQVSKFNNAIADSPGFQFAGTSVSRSHSIRVHGRVGDSSQGLETRVRLELVFCRLATCLELARYDSRLDVKDLRLT